MQPAQFVQVLRADACKFIQQLLERFALALSYLPQSVKFLKRSSLAKLQNHFHSRHPIGALGVNEVADNVIGAPRVTPFILMCQRVRQLAQKSIESGGAECQQRTNL